MPLEHREQYEAIERHARHDLQLSRSSTSSSSLEARNQFNATQRNTLPFPVAARVCPPQSRKTAGHMTAGDGMELKPRGAKAA